MVNTEERFEEFKNSLDVDKDNDFKIDTWLSEEKRRLLNESKKDGEPAGRNIEHRIGEYEEALNALKKETSVSSKDEWRDISHALSKIEGFEISSHGRHIPLKSLSEEKLPKRELRIRYTSPHKDALSTIKAARENIVKGEIMTHNMHTIEGVIKNNEAKEAHSVVSTKRFSIESYLGGLDTKDLYVRDELYDVWSGVNDKYDELDSSYNEVINKVRELLEVKHKKIEEEEGEEETEEAKSLSKTIEKLANWEAPPKYVLEFDPIQMDNLQIAGRFLNYVHDLFVVYNISKDIGVARDTSNEDTEGGEQGGDVEAQRLIEGNIAEALDEKSPEEKEFGNTMFDPKDSNDPDDDQLLLFEKDLDIVDPLLAQYMELNKDKLVAITDKGYGELVDKLEGWLENAQIKTDDEGSSSVIQIDSRIRQDVEDIRDSISVEMGRSGTEYWLPYTIAFDLKDITVNRKVVRGEEIQNGVEDFLRQTANFLSEEHFRFPTAPTKLHRQGIGSNLEPMVTREIQGKKVQAAQSGRHAKISGSGDTTNITDMAKDMEETIKKFLDALSAYYFRPLHGGKVPNRIPNFIVSNPARKIMAISRNFKVEVLMGEAYKDMLETKINVDAEELDDIYNFLKAVTSTGITDIDSSLTDMGEKAVKALNTMFEWGDRNEEHIGAIIYYIIHEENENSELIDHLNINGKSLKELSERFHDGVASGNEYPLFALPYYLEDNLGLYHSEIDTETQKSSTNLRNLLHNIKDMPLLLKHLLKVHDEIRKIKGKKVNFAMRPMTIDNYEEVIEKIYTNHRVDLAHIEIEKIVQEVDSFSSIAKCYGITEEIVYQVKSEFR